MSIVKISWSGGKDSTVSVLKHLERGDICKVVCYIPFFTENIPLIRKSHYDFILSTKKRFEDMGATVYIVKGLTYYDYVTHISKKGKHKGKMFGFPCPQNGKCGFKRDSKLKALNSVDVGFYDFESVGIAFDEPKRFNNLSDSKRSILVELGLTETDCFNICLEDNFLSPIYSNGNTRDGCALCYNACSTELHNWLSDYPEAYSILINLQNLVKIYRPERSPLRNHLYFIN